MPVHPLRGWLEQMAMADMGWEVFLRLTQVSGNTQVGVPCQLRCIEDHSLSARSSLTPRSVSSGPQAVVILILSTGIEIKSHIGHAFANLRIVYRSWGTDANADSACKETKHIVIQLPLPPLPHTHKHTQTHLTTHMHNNSCLNSCFPRGILIMQSR